MFAPSLNLDLEKLGGSGAKKKKRVSAGSGDPGDVGAADVEPSEVDTAGVDVSDVDASDA